MSIVFQAWLDTPELEILDEVENTRFTFGTDRQPTPSGGDPDRFYFPVDDVTAIETSTLETPKLLDVYVRDAHDGEMLAQSASGSGLAVGPGEYNVEVVTSEVKIYLYVESAVVVERREESVVIDFGDETEVTVGARSYHDRPAHTVAVPPDDVGAAMEAVSTFGSALKSLTPERSYPTLRGHPPLLEPGDELAIPDDVAVPDTGVRIEVPPEWETLFPVASLAYYLGANVVPTDDEPRLVTDRGFEHALDGEGGFEATVARTLKQVFFLDCLVRTEGYYEIALHERALTEPDLDLDFAALYDRSIAEQVETYLRQDYDVIRSAMPAWKQTADVWPSPDQLQALPHAANDLALIRCPDLPEAADPDPLPKAVVDFYRSPEGDGGGGGGGVAAAGGRVISPEPTDSLEHVWYGDGYPMGATKGSVEACRRQFDAEPREDMGIDVAVVCNDPRMVEEQETVAEFYGADIDREFDVTHYREMTTGDLRELLQTEMDFLHFVGHVEPHGIECLDGMLDVYELDWAGPKAFLLNGCESYVQAQGLIEKGSLGGVATLSKVGNRTALAVGKWLSRLLNHGYPLGTSLAIATDELLTGMQYATFGTVQVELVRNGGIPNILTIEREGDIYRTGFKTFPSGQSGIGGHAITNVGEVRKHYLDARILGERELTLDQLKDYLSESVIPLKIEGELHWSDEIALDDI